jgi:hypothetical protein
VEDALLIKKVSSSEASIPWGAEDDGACDSVAKTTLTQRSVNGSRLNLLAFSSGQRCSHQLEIHLSEPYCEQPRPGFEMGNVGRQYPSCVCVAFVFHGADLVGLIS